ncbi:hypothetical protein [Desulfosediminicola flagellatus]|uniref:hypothetical protein n=1 Tax=Desulfosediminicola flagellatus TaxID=2569541 RepID=UPI0010ACC393|nr:hypothetical protein [Desulfosediminicola flagellatus]
MNQVCDRTEQTIGKPVELAHPNIIWIMVKLKDQDISTARFFIVTALQIQDVFIKSYRAMLSKHGGIRPRNPHTLHCALFTKDLIGFEDNWSLFETI